MTIKEILQSVVKLSKFKNYKGLGILPPYLTIKEREKRKWQNTITQTAL